MRRLSPMAIAMTLLAVLGACSDQKNVGPIDDPTTRSAGSPSPSKPTAPPLPAAAKGDDVDAAVAFTKHYIKLLNYAANTGDVEPLEAASKGCGGCDKYIAFYRKTYADGGYLKNPGWTPVSPLGRAESGRTTVVTEVDAPAVTYVKRAGATAKEGSDTTYSLRFQAEFVESKWLMVLMVGE